MCVQLAAFFGTCFELLWLIPEEAREDDQEAADGACKDPAPPTVHGETSVCVQLAAFLGTCFELLCLIPE
jgi:hypothetical protein